jgi:hypothetical protein
VRLIKLLVLVKEGEEPAGVIRGAPEFEDKGSGVGFALEELKGDQILGVCVHFKVSLEGSVIDEIRLDLLRYE